MVAESDNWIGQSIAGGRYRVEAKLGEGAMGFVYRAHDRNLDDHVALKVPLRSMLEDSDFSERFATEVRKLVPLLHPSLVRVIDVSVQDDLPFVVTQYFSGKSLRDRQRREAVGKPTIPPEELKLWLEPVATALDFIHNHDFVHRGVKPENILFDEHGHAYVSDFAIAHVLAGKPQRRQTATTAGSLPPAGAP